MAECKGSCCADGPPPPERVLAAAAAALDAAAVKARSLAEEEEHEAQKLIGQALEAQGRLVDRRSQQFAQMVQALGQERASLKVRFQGIETVHRQVAGSWICG